MKKCETNDKKIIFLLAILLLSIGIVRCWTLIDINIKYKSVFYLKNKPVIRRMDGFYYMRLSQKISQGKYNVNSIDMLRDAPLHKGRFSMPPLISLIEGKLANFLKISPEWIDLVFTPFMSILLIIPLYLFFCKIKLPLVGFSASLVTIFAPGYMLRALPMSSDTDCGNLFFPILLAFFSFAFIRLKKKTENNIRNMCSNNIYTVLLLVLPFRVDCCVLSGIFDIFID